MKKRIILYLMFIDLGLFAASSSNPFVRPGTLTVRPKRRTGAQSRRTQRSQENSSWRQSAVQDAKNQRPEQPGHQQLIYETRPAPAVVIPAPASPVMLATPARSTTTPPAHQSPEESAAYPYPVWNPETKRLDYSRSSSPATSLQNSPSIRPQLKTQSSEHLLEKELEDMLEADMQRQIAKETPQIIAPKNPSKTNPIRISLPPQQALASTATQYYDAYDNDMAKEWKRYIDQMPDRRIRKIATRSPIRISKLDKDMWKFNQRDLNRLSVAQQPQTIPSIWTNDPSAHPRHSVQKVQESLQNYQDSYKPASDAQNKQCKEDGKEWLKNDQEELASQKQKDDQAWAAMTERAIQAQTRRLEQEDQNARERAEIEAEIAEFQEQQQRAQAQHTQHNALQRLNTEAEKVAYLMELAKNPTL